MVVAIIAVGAGLAMRANRASLRSLGIFSNRLLWAGIAFEIALVATLANVPWLADAFHMAPLGVWNWLFLLIWAPLVLGAEETRKAVLRRRGSKQ